MNLLESKTVLPDSNGVQSLTPALPPHLPSNGADSCPTEVKYRLILSSSFGPISLCPFALDGLV